MVIKTLKLIGLLIAINYNITHAVAQDYYYGYGRTIDAAVIQAYVGGNLQFFDHPFFKTETNKYSDVTFTTNNPKCFGLEIIFPKEVHNKTYLMAGLYYSDADMAYMVNSGTISTPNTVSVGFGGSFSMGHPLRFGGMSIGLYKDVQIYNRFYLGLSSTLCVGSYFMDNYLKDTTLRNEQQRKKRRNPIYDNLIRIEQPPKLYHKINFRLKNNINFSYCFSKRIAMKIGFTYNFGLPNKVFERNVHIYDINNMDEPISNEKAVFSNSSAEFQIGFQVFL